MSPAPENYRGPNEIDATIRRDQTTNRNAEISIEIKKRNKFIRDVNELYELTLRNDALTSGDLKDIADQKELDEIHLSTAEKAEELFTFVEEKIGILNLFHSPFVVPSSIKTVVSPYQDGYLVSLLYKTEHDQNPESGRLKGLQIFCDQSGKIKIVEENTTDFGRMHNTYLRIKAVLRRKTDETILFNYDPYGDNLNVEYRGKKLEFSRASNVSEPTIIDKLNSLE